PAVDLALDRRPEAVRVEDRDAEPGLAVVAVEFGEVALGHMVVAAGPVVLVLDGDDGPGLAGTGDLEVADLAGEGGDVAAGGLEEGLVRAAELDVRQVQGPDGDAAEVPPAADVGARAEDDPEVEFL